VTAEPTIKRCKPVPRCPLELDEEDIERIATRVVALLSAPERNTPVANTSGSILTAEQPTPTPARLVDAATLAQALGVEREWVYAHARQLGAIRLGGPQGRLRFDLAQARDLLARPSPPARPPTTRRQRPRRIGDSAELLPIRGAKRTINELGGRS
jgi:hypothetical protein